MNERIGEFDPDRHSVAQLRRLMREANAKGFQVRQEPLGNQVGSWCDIGGRATIFIDAAQSAGEQLQVLQQALEQYRPPMV